MKNLEQDVLTLKHKVDTDTEDALSAEEAAKLNEQIQALLAEVNEGISSAKASEPESAEAVVAKINAMDIPDAKRDELVERVTGVKPERVKEVEQKESKENEIEKLERELTASRESYLNTVAAFKKEKSLWDTWKQKTNGLKSFFTKVDENKSRELKHPNSKDVENRTKEYAAARSNLTEKYYQDKKAELEALKKNEQEVEAELKIFRTEKRIEMQARETVLVNQGRADRMGEEKKGLWQKALDHTMGLGTELVNVGVSVSKLYQKLGEWGPELTLPVRMGKDAEGKTIWYKYKTGKLVRSAAIGAIGGGTMGAAWLGLRLARGVAISTGTAKALNVLDTKQGKKASDFQAQYAHIEDAYASGKMSLTEYEEQLAGIQKSEKKSKRLYDLGRVAVMAATVGVGYEAGHLQNELHDHMATAAGGAGMPPAVPPHTTEAHHTNGHGKTPEGKVKAIATPVSKDHDTHPAAAKAVPGKAAYAVPPLKSGENPDDAVKFDMRGAQDNLAPHQAPHAKFDLHSQSDAHHTNPAAKAVPGKAAYAVPSLKPGENPDNAVKFNVRGAQGSLAQHQAPHAKVELTPKAGAHPLDVEKAIGKPLADSPKAVEQHHAAIPKEAIIGKGNVSITHAFKMQLEADPKLAHELGYDKAPNKALFLKHLGEKLGYIGKDGENVGVQAGMGEAYVLHSVAQPDGTFAPTAEEYQNGSLVETHHSGDAFEDKTHEEKYEYTRLGGTNEHHAEHAASDHTAHRIEGAHETDHTAHKIEGTQHRETIDQRAFGNQSVEENNPDAAIVDETHTTDNYSIEDNDNNGDVNVNYNDASQYHQLMDDTPVYREEATKILTKIFGHRDNLFGSKAIDSDKWIRLKDLNMTEVLGKDENFPRDLHTPLHRLAKFIGRSGVAPAPTERVEQYLQRVAHIRAEGK